MDSIKAKLEINVEGGKNIKLHESSNFHCMI